LRISIYTPTGKHIQTIIPKERSWMIEHTEGGLKIRFRDVAPGSHVLCVTDRIEIIGKTTVIIQEEKDNNG
jgi:hypothetical protein